MGSRAYILGFLTFSSYINFIFKNYIMVKVRLILMFQGKVEHDIETQMIKPRLKEVITLPEHGEHYPIKFIQHFFNEQGEFQYIMVTGIRKS